MKTLEIDDKSWEKLKIDSIINKTSIKEIISSTFGDMRHCVYELVTSDGSYIGYTGDVYSRLITHRSTRDTLSFRVIKVFDKKQDALIYEKKMILEIENINNTGILENLCISSSSLHYSKILTEIVNNADNLFCLENGYINKRLLENYCSSIANKKVLIRRKFDEFEDEICKKDSLSISDLSMGGKGDTDIYLHPLLAFDLGRLSSPVARVEFISFACDMVKDANAAIEIGISKAKDK